MTRDTDRPRRGTDKAAGRARPPRSDKTGPGGRRPARDDDKTFTTAFGTKSVGTKASSTKASSTKGPYHKAAGARSFGTKASATTFGDKPKRDARAVKPNRSSDASQRAVAPAGSDAIATIATPARQRIAKLMARVGLCSRRDAEAWIVDGRVTLNGDVLTSPAMDVGPNDVILVDGIPLPAAEKTRLFLFHKPRGLVTSDHDPEGRETVADYLADNWPDGPRVVTIGRLDINTEGLLLLTNDGGLARVLELPATGWVRRYRVRAKGETDQGILDRLRDGIVVDGVDYAGIEAKLDRIQGANCWLTMGLREGKNREIKRVLEHLGLEVNRLIRLSFGPFQLLDLPEGKVEEVKTRILRDQLGETLAAEAGVDFADSEAPIVAPPVATRETITKPSRRGEASKPERRPDTTRGDRSVRPSSEDRGARARFPRDRVEDEAPPIRERPVAGTRRHVSTLRAEVAADQRKGPRKRIERVDTTDRKDRIVKVERLVGVRTAETEPPRARRGAGRFASRDGDERQASRGHASPSALAKRERIAKSSGVKRGDTRSEGARSFPERSYEDRGDRRGATGGAKTRSVKPHGVETRSVKPHGVETRSVKPHGVETRSVKPHGVETRSVKPRATDAREKPFRAREGGRDERGGARAGDEKPWRSDRSSEGERVKTRGSDDRDARSTTSASRGERPARTARPPRGNSPGGMTDGKTPRPRSSPKTRPPKR